MRLSARSEYGVLALIDLACRVGEGPVSARGVAERQNIPPKFLEQLFVSLRKAGLVSAVRGSHGGFMLARDPDVITVLQVVEALDGPVQPSVCCASEGCARSDACAAATVWNDATSALRSVFSEATLGGLARAQCAIGEAAQLEGRVQ